MKKRLSKIISLIIVVSMLLSLVACQSNEKTTEVGKKGEETTKQVSEEKRKEDEKVTLRIYAQYSSDDEIIPFDYAVEELAKEMPNVELELEVMGQDDNQKIKTYAATGNLPDIFQANMDVISTLKNSKNILVLDKYVENLNFKDKMFQSTEKLLVTEDGHAYAFPWAGNDAVLLYYNKEVFEKYNVKVPTTYEELKNAVEIFNSNDIVPLALFAKEKWPCVALYDMFATRMDSEGVLKMNNGEAKASDEAFRVAAERISELVKNGLLPKGATNLNYDQAAALFYTGEAAMFINGQWEIAASTEKLGDKLDYMYYPAADAASVESTKYAFSGGGSPGGFAVSPDTKDKELSTKVAAFMAEKMAEARYALRGNVVSATKVNKAPEKPLDPVMDKFSKDITNITSTTAFAWGLSNAKFKAGLEDEAQKLMLPDYSAELFVEEMDKVIERANKK